MKKQIVGLVLLATSLSSFAVDFNQLMREEVLNIQSLRSMTASDLNAPKACRKRYRELFPAGGTVRISLGLGYADSTPGNVVWDGYMITAFLNGINARCEPGLQFCGFSRDKVDPLLFRKIVTGPTGETNTMVELRITQGAIGRDNASNLSPQNKERQMRACQAATAKFMGEVAAGADIALYFGHSRNGGGPDFCPPVRTADGQHVNYDWYRAHRPGITALLDSMKEAAAASKPNKVVGMFSCSSQLHFARRFVAANPKAGYLLTSRTITFGELFQDIYAAVDGLLAQRCADGFEDSFERRKDGTRWYNMF